MRSTYRLCRGSIDSASCTTVSITRWSRLGTAGSGACSRRVVRLNSIECAIRGALIPTALRIAVRWAIVRPAPSRITRLLAVGSVRATLIGSPIRSRVTGSRISSTVPGSTPVRLDRRTWVSSGASRSSVRDTRPRSYISTEMRRRLPHAPRSSASTSSSGSRCATIAPASWLRSSVWLSVISRGANAVAPAS